MNGSAARLIGAFLCLLFCSRVIAQAPTPKTIKVVSYIKGRTSQTGTAFFIDSKGIAVTNYHVIVGAYRIDAFFPNQPFFQVDVLAIDPTRDLAVLHVRNLYNTSYFSQNPFPTLQPKDLLQIVGWLNGVSDSTLYVRTTKDGFVKSGDLIPEGKTIFADGAIDLLSIDGLIYDGMSGSPVIDLRGNVLAVISGSFSTGGSQGWAIPIKYLPQWNLQHIIEISSYSWPRFTLMTVGASWDHLTRDLNLGDNFVADRDRLAIFLAKIISLESLEVSASLQCESSLMALSGFFKSVPDNLLLPTVIPSLPASFASTYKREVSDCGGFMQAREETQYYRDGTMTLLANLVSSASALATSNPSVHMSNDLEAQTNASMASAVQLLNVMKTRSDNIFARFPPALETAGNMKTFIQVYIDIIELFSSGRMAELDNKYVAAADSYQKYLSSAFISASTAK